MFVDIVLAYGCLPQFGHHQNLAVAPLALGVNIFSITDDNCINLLASVMACLIELKNIGNIV